MLVETLNTNGSEIVTRLLDKLSQQGAPYNVFRLIYDLNSVEPAIEKGLNINEKTSSFLNLTFSLNKIFITPLTLGLLSIVGIFFPADFSIKISLLILFSSHFLVNYKNDVPNQNKTIHISIIDKGKINKIFETIKSQVISYYDKALADKIINDLTKAFTKIKEKIESGEINLDTKIRLSIQDIGKPVSKKARIGMLSLSGNPIHWGHLIIALNAIAEYSLSKVVLMVRGVKTEKPILAETVKERHEMAVEVSNLFGGLIEYSSILKGTDESIKTTTGIWNLLDLNKDVEFEIWFIVGSDHQFYYNPKSVVDKTGKLKPKKEWKLDIIGILFNEVKRGKLCKNLKVKLLINKRPGEDRATIIKKELGMLNKQDREQFLKENDKKIKTEAKEIGLKIKTFHGQSFEISSTKIREAFARTGEEKYLTFLPKIVLDYINSCSKYKYYIIKELKGKM